MLLAACGQRGDVNVGSSATLLATNEVEGAAGSPTVTAVMEVTATQPAATTLTATPAVAPTEVVAARTPETGEEIAFDGQRAYEQLQAQMAFGPRWPGSPAHDEAGDYIVSELEALGWQVEEQFFDYQGAQGRNIIARANLDLKDAIILGAHYDTRRLADQTPGAAEEQRPVPGAVDGASGVAVLLELARSLDLDQVSGEVWLAFFDLEDNGGGAIAGWDWIVGSTYMAQNLSIAPDAVRAMILVDMIGDVDQQLYYEGNSDEKLREEIWDVAAGLGYDNAFVPEVKYTMIDDHVPFTRQGIPAVDIIDFDYPYWHTTEDTADKASAESLERVGRTLEVWLQSRLD
jgi:hypothetical protein